VSLAKSASFGFEEAARSMFTILCIPSAIEDAISVSMGCLGNRVDGADWYRERKGGELGK